MKSMCTIDSKGNWNGTVLKEDDYVETKRIKEQWEENFLKPKWSFDEEKWIESATDEELNPPTDETQTDKERIDSLENTVLELADLILSGGETNVN